MFYIDRLCMLANIPLATRNKLNCFICARHMLSIILHCDHVFFFVELYMLIIILSKENIYIQKNETQTFPL